LSARSPVALCNQQGALFGVPAVLEAVDLR
jgi:hypothetical protein